MKRILVFGMTENPGGVETFLLNYYRNIDRSKVQFDFLCNFPGPAAFEEELTALGGRTYHITARSKNPGRYRKELEEVFRKHSGSWSAVWVNVSSLANIDYLKAARRSGIKKRIIHSHNSRNMDSRLRGLLHWWNRRIVDRYATDFWACSDFAAEWFYRKDLLPKVRIVRNAIDAERVSFDPGKRAAVREQLRIGEHTFVIGNVGRLHFQKNQMFALEVFREYLKQEPDSRLILVGQGEDETILKERAAGMADKVIFAGVQKDMQAWLSAFDFFLFPSNFEGLGIAALEAQANGLPVLASEGVIPPEVKVTGNLSFCGLDRSAGEWAEKIGRQKRIDDRETIMNAFRSCGYDIFTEAPELQRLLSE